MSATVRAFVAIELPDAVRTALGAAIAEIGAFPGVRPVRPEGVHLTLKFLGDIGVERVGPLSEAIVEVARPVAPFALGVGGTGAFPSSRAPGVFWAGITGELGPLRELWRALEGATSDLGFAEERRGFSPHLTLARVRRGSSPEEIRKAVDALSRVEFDDGLRIPVNRLCLMRSTLGPQGASYDTLASAHLTG